MSDFFSEEQRRRLQDANGRTCNGFLLLLDIKDSTARKREYKNRWIEQTKELYIAFGNFCQRVADVLEVDAPIVKFKGDGLMAFFKTASSSTKANDEKAPAETAISLLSQVYIFRESVHVEMGNDLGDMRLKTVLCYLTGVSEIGSDGNHDVLGRGIDFAFRLERYADASHFVANDMLYRALPQHDDKGVMIRVSSEAEIRLHGVPCRKALKGWPGEQRFWLLTTPDWIATTMETSTPSPHEGNALVELFHYYVTEMGKREGKGAQGAEDYHKAMKVESDGLQ